MTIQTNRVRYLLSLADELRSQSKRVRDLIGDAHWLSDGHHKEYLLLNVLRRHLPANTIAGRGFVISCLTDSVRSREQDILVVDNSLEAPVFYQSGLIITFPRQVLASISVKTRLGRQEISDSVKSLNGVREIVYGETHRDSLWCGGYFFEETESISKTPSDAFAIIHQTMGVAPVWSPATSDGVCGVAPDILTSSNDLAFLITQPYRSDEHTLETASVAGYECSGMATAVFLASLLDHISAVRGSQENDFAGFLDAAKISVSHGPETLD